MTKEELLKNTTWDEYEMGNCPLFVPLFSKKVPFIFFLEHPHKPSITDKMIECVHEILLLDQFELEFIKELVWEECKFTFTILDYGYEPKDGETQVEAYLNGFGIKNKEDAYSKSDIKEIHIAQEIDKLEGRYSEIKIDAASDNLISIIVKNGKIIDFDDDGTYVGSFEKDEKYAQKQRTKTLA